MSLDLKDFRYRITVEADCVLDAISQANGKDRAEIVREILQEWAMRQIHAANVMHKRLQGEGLSGIGVGK